MSFRREKISFSDYLFRMIRSFNNLLAKDQEIDNVIRQELLDISYVLLNTDTSFKMVDVYTKKKGSNLSNEDREAMLSTGKVFAYALFDYLEGIGTKDPEQETDKSLENMMEYVEAAQHTSNEETDELLRSLAAIAVRRMEEKGYKTDITHWLRHRIDQQYADLQRLIRLCAVQFKLKNNEVVVLMLL
jgi:hypothetical protein